jgi:hypothetical protein
MGWVEEAINTSIVPWQLQHKLYCFEEFQIISKNTFLKEREREKQKKSFVKEKEECFWNTLS